MEKEEGRKVAIPTFTPQKAPKPCGLSFSSRRGDYEDRENNPEEFQEP